MINLYDRIFQIREKIENTIFSNIYKFLKENNIVLNRKNFLKISDQLGYKTNVPYTKYVSFIKYYLTQKKGKSIK